MKQRIVIKPNAIRVTDLQNEQLPTTQRSLFSNHYDFDGEKERLGNLSTGSIYVAPEDPEHEAVRVFLYHQRLLKQHIYRNNLSGRARQRRKPEGISLDDYDIFMSVAEEYESVGKLRDKEQDYVYLHTKQAVRCWEGMNDRTKPHQRWPGIRYAMALSMELVRLTQKDNPFAYAALLGFERALDEVKAFFDEQTAKVQKLLDASAAQGIHINVMENTAPLAVPVGHIRGYGYRLIHLLTAYDMYIRMVKTLMDKGMVSNKNGNDMVRDGGRHIRRTTQELYLVTMRMRAIQTITRADFLKADESFRQKLQIAVDNNALEALPLGALLGSDELQFVFVQLPYDAEELDKIAAFARQYGLVAENMA